jgi:hypothetical protein
MAGSFFEAQMRRGFEIFSAAFRIPGIKHSAGTLKRRRKNPVKCANTT